MSSDGDYSGITPTSAEAEFYSLHGFYPYTGSEYYILRPEVLESNFYAWRVTGNTQYLDRAAAAMNSFQEYLQVGPGLYSGIVNVDVPPASGADRFDETDSFWFAETLKYL